MRVSVIICSIGRPGILDDTVQSLLHQTYPIDEILIGTPSTENVLPSSLEHPVVRLLLTKTGLTVQRNACLSSVKASSDLVVFVDDDMEFAPSYMAAMVELFEATPDLIVSSGNLLFDGGVGKSIGREEARRLCAGKQAESSIRTSPRRSSAYGCNMAYRASMIRDKSFDERLPLYGWLEDTDFSHSCTRGGRPPLDNLNAYAVHLGWRGGRISGRRLGFSQVVNPFYLWKKSRVCSLPHLVIHYWVRCIVGNILGLVWGEPIEDRPGRLFGNLLGFRHLLSGQLDPQHAAKITVPISSPANVTPIRGEPQRVPVPE